MIIFYSYFVYMESSNYQMFILSAKKILLTRKIGFMVDLMKEYHERLVL